MNVLQAPVITFKCRECGAVCEGKEHEFRQLRTMPPSFHAVCAWCGGHIQCFPTSLVAKAGVTAANRDAVVK